MKGTSSQKPAERPEPLNNAQSGKSGSEPPGRPPPDRGLLAVGVVVRRERRVMGEKNREVVTYTLDCGLQIQAWEPETYFSVGEFIHVNVAVSCWHGKSGIQWRLTLPGQDGEF